MIPLRDSHPAGTFPFWVLVIIALNVYVFFLELISANLEAFIGKFALIPALVNFNQWENLYPFLTSQFLHGGFLHIISNMLFLWIFGDNIEAAFGKFFFPIFYLMAGTVGGLTQYFFISDSNIPMLGASGAVAGILGAYFVLFPNHKIKTLIPIFGFATVVDIPASVMLVYWFITQLFAGTASLVTATADLGGVAFFAHIGGFAFGWVVAKMIKS